MSNDELIIRALQALVGCVSGDDELTKENASIAIVSDVKHKLWEGDELQPYLDRLEVKRADDANDDDDDAPPAGEETKDSTEGGEAMEK